MMDWTKLLEVFKLKWPILAAITLGLAAFLFVPDKTADDMGILKLRTDYKSYAGVALLFMAPLTIIQAIASGYGAYTKKHAEHKAREQAKEDAETLERKKREDAENRRKWQLERLNNLTVIEKQILCGFVLSDSRTQDLSIQDGHVIGLANAGIIYRASKVGNLHGRGFAFNIYDWAWDYLRQNPELITKGVPKDSQGRIYLYENPHNLLDE